MLPIWTDNLAAIWPENPDIPDETPREWVEVRTHNVAGRADWPYKSAAGTATAACGESSVETDIRLKHWLPTAKESKKVLAL